MDLILVFAEKRDFINILLLAVFLKVISNICESKLSRFSQQKKRIVTVINITVVVVLMIFTFDFSHDQ